MMKKRIALSFIIAMGIMSLFIPGLHDASSYAEADAVPLLPVHFTVLRNDERVNEVATKENLMREVDLMNRYFVDNTGKPLARFVFHSISFYDDIKDSPCEVVKQANRPVDTLTWINKVFSCRDSRVLDPRAFNFLVIDWYSKSHGYANATSFGGASILLPTSFVAIDWIYLKNPEHEYIRRHEMGHALGTLSHDCIMGDTEGCPDGVNRTVMGKGMHYSGKQSVIIRNHMKKVASMLEWMVPRTSIGNGSFENLEEGTGFKYWQGFSPARQIIYFTAMRGSPGVSGKVAAIVLKGEELYQWIEIAETGSYDIQVNVRTDGHGGELGVIVNGIKRKTLSLSPGEISKLNQPWLTRTDYRVYRLEELTFKKSDLIRLYVKAGSEKLVLDDFVMTRDDRR